MVESAKLFTKNECHKALQKKADEQILEFATLLDLEPTTTQLRQDQRFALEDADPCAEPGESEPLVLENTDPDFLCLSKKM